jgi:hypothetical protein
MLLHELPKEHPLRNKPVGQGLYHRWHCLQGEAGDEWFTVSAWKKIPEAGSTWVDMPIAKYTCL